MAKKNYSLKEMLESLDIPIENQYQDIKDMSSDKFVRSVSHFVTEQTAQKLWMKWNPDQAKRIDNRIFINAFQEMLAESASLGFRLNRFKEISKNLPEPTESRRTWIPFFEETIHDCNIRVYLNKKEYQELLGSDGIDDEKEQSFKQKIEMMSDGLFYELGLVFPLIDFLVDESLDTPYFRVEWNDFQLPPQKGLPIDKILVNDTVDRLTLLNIKGEEAINPANGSECAIISSENKEIVEQAGLTAWNPDEYLILVLSAKIRKNAAAFVNRSFIDLLLNLLNTAFPETVDQIRQRFDKDFLIQILRGLLAEEISIRNLYSILDFILSLQSTVYADLSKFIVFAISGGIIFSKTKNLGEIKVNDYVEMVRNHLKRYISHKYTRGGNTLVVYLMDPTAESRLKQSQKLSIMEHKELLNGVRDEIGNLPPTAQSPVILTTMEIRHRLRTEICSEFPNLAVLSYQELSPDMNIQPIARISPELFPLNESFNQLFKTLSKLSITHLKKATFDKAKLSKQDNDLLDFLNKYRKDILSMVTSRIIKNHPKQQISENDLQELIIRLLDVYFEQLFSSQNKLIEELSDNLSKAFAEEEIRISDIFEIPLIIKTVIRSLYIEKHSTFDGQESIQRFKKVLEKLELIAHNIASKFLKTGFHTKYYNFIH